MLIAYRENPIWQELREEIASYFKEDGESQHIQIFPFSTTEKEIEEWILANKSLVESTYVNGDVTVKLVIERLAKSKKLYTDPTNDGRPDLWKEKNVYACADLDLRLSEAFSEILREELGVSKGEKELYRELYKRLVESAQIKRVLVVRDDVADYNPLNIKGYDGRNFSTEKLEAYANEFLALVPDTVEKRVIDVTEAKAIRIKAIKSEVKGFGEQTLIILHHHSGLDNFRSKSPLIVSTYPSHFVSKVAEYCDISDLVTDPDIIGILREGLLR